MPVPRGRKSFPTRFSSTLLLPLLCAPHTAICGRSIESSPTLENTSCSRLIVGMSRSSGEDSGAAIGPLDPLLAPLVPRYLRPSPPHAPDSNRHQLTPPPLLKR